MANARRIKEKPVKKIARTYRLAHRLAKPHAKRKAQRIVPPSEYRTFVEKPVAYRMAQFYSTGWSLRELAARWHVAVPVVKRTLRGIRVPLKPQGRPRKELVA